jgi:ferritin-like metal-binding protein YciE
MQVAEITTPRELFLHELGDILYVEEQLANEVLPKLINEVQHDEFRTSLENHLEETRGHVENVEQVFSTLGESPRPERCIGFEGLKQEKEELTGKVSGTMIDAVNTGAAARTEHYEIAAYSGLIEKARALGEQDIVNLLDENLKEEKEALRQVESVEKTIRDEIKAGAV